MLVGWDGMGLNRRALRGPQKDVTRGALRRREKDLESARVLSELESELPLSSPAALNAATPVTTMASEVRRARPKLAQQLMVATQCSVVSAHYLVLSDQWSVVSGQ